MLLSRAGPAVIAAGLMLSSTAAAADGDLVRGERVFRMQCAGCHAVEPEAHRAGPSLHGVVGRTAGSVEGFRFSAAMQEADLVWNADTLHAFLTNPEQVVPGTRMVFWGLDEDERNEVIRFLKSLSDD
ncbi:MAG: cytochrome c family protein [Ectothiorhodospiraceae bacterium]|nr:cytochrome c family protein [Ectothiorhodospiraceae bacterium]